MSGLILGVPKPKPKAAALPLQRCGNCFYADEHPGPEFIVCKGAPPTAVLLGMREDQLGRPCPVIEGFWPVVRKEQRRCSMWQDVGPKVDGASN